MTSPHRIRQLRRQIDHTIDAFAARLGVRPATVERWEGGEAEPDTRTARRLVALLDNHRHLAPEGVRLISLIPTQSTHRDLAATAFALVEATDEDRLLAYDWRLNGDGYAIARMDGRDVMMHRYLMDAPEGLVVDHINRVRIDNRRANLRVVSQAVNSRNRPMHRNGAPTKASIAAARAGREHAERQRLVNEMQTKMTEMQKILDKLQTM